METMRLSMPVGGDRIRVKVAVPVLQYENTVVAGGL